MLLKILRLTAEVRDLACGKREREMGEEEVAKLPVYEILTTINCNFGYRKTFLIIVCRVTWNKFHVWGCLMKTS